MATVEFINLSTVSAAVVGSLLTVGYQEANRIRRQRAEEKQETIDWYDDLRALAKEIHNDGKVSKTIYTSPGEVSVTEFLVGDDDVVDDKRKEQEIAEEWITSRCELYQGRLRKHWARAPRELDEEFDDTVLYLYLELVSMSTVTSLGGNLAVLDSIVDFSEEIVEECDDAVDELDSPAWYSWNYWFSE